MENRLCLKDDRMMIRGQHNLENRFIDQALSGDDCSLGIAWHLPDDRLGAVQEYVQGLNFKL